MDGDAAKRFANEISRFARENRRGREEGAEDRAEFNYGERRGADMNQGLRRR